MTAEILVADHWWFYIALWFGLIALASAFILLTRSAGRRKAEAPEFGCVEQIDVFEGDVTFWFDHSDEPWSNREFLEGSEKRRLLKAVEDAVLDYNNWARYQLTYKE